VHLPTEHVLARERTDVGVLHEREVRDGREVGREVGAVSVREGDAEDDEVRVGGRGHGARAKEETRKISLNARHRRRPPLSTER
jgi:hypothetical protein